MYGIVVFTLSFDESYVERLCVFLVQCNFTQLQAKQHMCCDRFCFFIENQSALRGI